MIRKYLYLASIIFASTNLLNAQTNISQFPSSFNNSVALITPETIHFGASDNTSGLNSTEGAYKVAKVLGSDISFPSSGILTKLDDGSFAWRVVVKADEAKAVGFYYDAFQLPQGVAMYVYNDNKKHVEGPYTIEHNDEQNVFVTDAIQGETVWLELNIDNGVNLDDIQLHIDKVASYFRGVDELLYYSDEYGEHGTFDYIDDAGYGSSSKCGINANCPTTEGYDIAKNATVKEVIPGEVEGYVGFCTGTMINNSSNAPGSCKKYLLTATHCEGMNVTGVHPSFGQWLLKFNYQSADCDNPTVAPVSDRLEGVKFLSRDPYNSSASAGELDADFLLLEVRKPISNAWNVTMAGWNRNPSHQLAYVGDKKFVFFHHPAGDIKKYSSTKNILNEYTPLWTAIFTEGYGAQGSSGSAMFNNDQHIMGIASTANFGFNVPDSCFATGSGVGTNASTSARVNYAKVSYAWENPSISSPTDAQKLKPWLDPANTGAMSIGAVKANDCTSTSSIDDLSLNFKGDFNIYPNPSSNGIFQMNIRMDEPTAGNVQVVDIAGRPVFNTNVPKLQSQIINLDLNHLANGVYLVKISNQFGQITKKVVINK